jgi:serine protease inhibitor
MGWFKPKVQENSASLQAAVQANTGFALDLYQKLRATEGNLFFSPYSISTALAMTYAGARGDTQTQMARALHFLPDQDQLHPAFAQLAARLEQAARQKQIQLMVANALWPAKGFPLLKEFLALAKKYYGVRITPVDFSAEETARHTINGWVEEKTENRIKDLIAPDVLEAATRLVLVNAIYFKGAWASPFDPALTGPAPFFTAAGASIQVPMMNRKKLFRYAESQDLQILELPYAGNSLSMLVFLPRENEGLARLEDSLVNEKLDEWIRDLAETEVQVSLPGFELTFPFRLDDTLKSMGMIDAFSDKADFSAMDASRTLFIGAVLHKAFVAVNEQGTEAAAASAVVMQLKTVAFPSIVFRADHPFIFLIREKETGSLLFIGRVVNPA